MVQAPKNETIVPKDSTEHRGGTSINYSNPQYSGLISEVDSRLISHRKISYLPVEADQELADAHNIEYLDAESLRIDLQQADVIICISRDEQLDPDYTGQYPERNIALTRFAKSNVDKAVELFKLAQAEGNTEIKFIATGRMHNREIRMMLALPIIAEAAGINAEDAYHIDDQQFKRLLDSLFTPENIESLRLDDNSKIEAHVQAVRSLLKEAGYESSDSTSEELEKVANKLYEEYKKYPRISTSRLMAERAAERGVPLEAISEEDGSVDTISSLINTAVMMTKVKEFAKLPVRKVVIVAGSDHLPRTTWLANHILPDDIDITSVESPVLMSDEDYARSCERELNSLLKGSEWIGGTRDLKELNEIVEAGYFSTSRLEADELARAVASARALGNVTFKNN